MEKIKKLDEEAEKREEERKAEIKASQEEIGPNPAIAA